MTYSTGANGRSLNQLLATVFGAVYILVAAIGFLVAETGLVSLNGGKVLGIFEVNHLHNVAHLAIGALLLFAGRAGHVPARSANLAVGATYLLLGVVGLFIIGTEANILALNGADNVLHFGSALVLMGVALAADKTVAAPVARS